MLDFNVALKQSCEDLELDLHMKTARSNSRNCLSPEPALETRRESSTSHDDIIDLTDEASGQLVVTTGQVQQPVSFTSESNPKVQRSHRLPTPISTKKHQIKRNQMEKSLAVPFVQDLLSQGLNFDQIRERYMYKFGIWRSTASLASYHSKHKKRLTLVLKIPPSRLREIMLETRAHHRI